MIFIVIITIIIIIIIIRLISLYLSFIVHSKVYKKLGQTHLAQMNFSWAIDLDPKGANNQIKDAIDKRYLPDDDDSTLHETSMDQSGDITDEDIGLDNESSSSMVLF